MVDHTENIHSLRVVEGCVCQLEWKH